LYYTTLPKRQPDKKIDNAPVYPEIPSPLMGTFGIYFSKSFSLLQGIFNFNNGSASPHLERYRVIFTTSKFIREYLSGKIAAMCSLYQYFHNHKNYWFTGRRDHMF